MMSAIRFATQALLLSVALTTADDVSCVAPGRKYVEALSVLQTRQSRSIAEQPSSELELLANCGYDVECPLNYSLATVNKLAESAQAEADRYSEARVLLHHEQRQACEKALDTKNTILEHGGWCYELDQSQLVKAAPGSNDMDYNLPLHHVVADDVLVDTLAKHILLKEDGSCCHSLTDLGAGVGQYGHALRARLPKLEYYGYDGAGNVEEFTKKYVEFADLTQPLSEKRTDWVMSAEVGEHIPHAHEAQVIANIHAHNCKGVILTWAVPGQYGTGHINCHSNQYIISIFESLGYKLNQDITTALRAPREPQTNGEINWWFYNSSMAFDRITPPASCGR